MGMVVKFLTKNTFLEFRVIIDDNNQKLQKNICGKKIDDHSHKIWAIIIKFLKICKKGNIGNKTGRESISDVVVFWLFETTMWNKGVNLVLSKKFLVLSKTG